MMRYQLKVTRTVKVSLFLLAIMVSCLVLQQFFLRNVDHNSLRIEGFYQEETDSLDVVFIGASDIYTSFMPGRAYEQYGFTSYLLASESITSEGIKTAVKATMTLTRRMFTSFSTTFRSARIRLSTSTKTCLSISGGNTFFR